MRRYPGGLVRLLACLLLAHWAGAALPHVRALAQLASAQVVELCSHDGLRQILIDEDGQPVEADRAPDFCTLCFGPAALPVAEPSPIAYALVAGRFPQERLPTNTSRAPPQQPRARPST